MSTRSANDNTDNEVFVIDGANSAAGFIIRHSAGYRFFAADERFHMLDGSVFKSVEAAQRAVAMIENPPSRN